MGSSVAASDMSKTLFRERSKMNYEQLLQKYHKKLKNINKPSKKEFDIPLKSTSQLNKKGKDKSSRKSDASAKDPSKALESTDLLKAKPNKSRADAAEKGERNLLATVQT